MAAIRHVTPTSLLAPVPAGRSRFTWDRSEATTDGPPPKNGGGVSHPLLERYGKVKGLRDIGPNGATPRVVRDLLDLCHQPGLNRRERTVSAD
jgi:hypothetical protein